VTKPPQDPENHKNNFSNLWSFIGLGALIIVAAIIIVFLLSKRKKKSKPHDILDEPIFPSLEEISCPDCNHVFDIPSEPRPLEVQCPSCGTKGSLK
jgi:hypothetical protein